MAAIDKILRKSNFTAAMAALATKLNSLFVRKETGKGLSTNDYTTAEKNKLAGIAAGANNYTLPTASGTVLGGVKIGDNVQIASGVISVDLSGKVDKVAGKGLSTNDYTTAEKTKLAGVATGANNYVLPVPTASSIGGVKAGDNVTISEDGTISAIQGKVDLSSYAKKGTTLAAYGITDAKIAGGVITLGANTITPLTRHQSLAAYAKSADVESTYAKKTDITTVYKYRGSVDTYAKLPVNGQSVGDVYNVVAADTSHNIKPGDNVVWNGNAWDNLSGVVDLSAYAKSADVASTYMKINDFPLATDDEITAIVNETIV